MAVTLRKVTDRKINTVPCTFNTPCPSAGRTFTPITMIAGKPVAKSAPDYSDGYGSTYAVGE